MANKRIQDLPAKGATIAANDILEVSEYQSPGIYTSKKILGSELGGVTSFEDLTDTFTFAGNELETVRVNAAGTALETYTPTTVSTGRFGIADSSGVYTYYTTLTLAMTAATSGQTIEFFTDYTETGAVTITLKDGVTINGNGHTYTHNSASANHSFSANTINEVYRIFNLRVVRLNGTTASCVRLLANGCELYADGSYFQSNNVAVACVSNSSMFNVTAKTTNSLSDSIYTDGKLYNSVGSGAGLGISGSGTAYNCTGISTGTDGMRIASAYNSVGISSATYGIYNTTANGYYSNCQGYSSASYGIRNNGANSTFIHCDAFSTGWVGFGAVGATIMENCTAYSSTDWALYLISAKISNSSSFSSSNYGAYIDGTVSMRNCSIESSTSHAAFVTVASNNLVDIVNTSFVVGNSANNCLRATGAVTIKYANNAFKGATTAVNANITQGVSNSHDSQGNILI